MRQHTELFVICPLKIMLMLLKTHRKAGQTAGSNTSRGSTTAKSGGVSRKKLGVGKINKQRGGYVARTTILSAFPALLHLEFWIGEEHLQPADNWSEVAEHADTIHWFEGLYAACVRQPTFFWKNHPVYLALKWLTSFINKPDTILIWESLALFSRH